MKRYLEKVMLKCFPATISALKLEVKKPDIFMVVLTKEKLSDEEQMYLASEIKSELMYQRKIVNALQVSCINTVIITDNIDKFNEEIDYNNIEYGGYDYDEYRC